MKHSRKFSIDLPRLKIGSLKSSKQDQAVVHSPLPWSYFEPPPQPPKSVRPPLPAQIDAELRAACTSVVTDYRPSHKYFAPRPWDVSKQQLDYAAVKATAHRDEHVSYLPRHQRAITTDVSLAVRPDLSRHRRTSVLNDVVSFYDDSTHGYVPHRINIVSADTLAQDLSGTGRPRLCRRAESGETNGSTPHTDNTDYPWSDKVSTAMTSAVVTPAHTSNRGSGQAQPAFEDVSGPITEPPRITGWVEKDKVQGPEQPINSAFGDAPVRAALAPARKPVPSYQRASAAGAARETTLTSVLLERPPRSASPRRDLSVQRDASAALRNATHDMSRHARPDSRQAYEGSDERIPRRRSRSITCQVKDYIRSASRGRGSSLVDTLRSRSRSVSRAHSRAQSRDRSDGDHSLHRSSSRSRWRSFTSLHRTGASADSPDLSRPESSGSDNRGRREPVDTITRPKPPIDLNRALPPLPGLDQWQDEHEISGQLQHSSLKRVDPLRANPPDSNSEVMRRPSNRRLSKSYNDVPDHPSRANRIEASTQAQTSQFRRQAPGSDNRLPHRSMSVSVAASRTMQVFELEGSTPLFVDPSSMSRPTHRREDVPPGRPTEKRRAFVRTDSDFRNNREFGGGLRPGRRQTTDFPDGPLPSRYQALALRPDASPVSPLTVTVDRTPRGRHSTPWSSEAVGESSSSPPLRF